MIILLLLLFFCQNVPCANANDSYSNTITTPGVALISDAKCEKEYISWKHSSNVTHILIQFHHIQGLFPTYANEATSEGEMNISLPVEIQISGGKVKITAFTDFGIKASLNVTCRGGTVVCETIRCYLCFNYLSNFNCWYIASTCTIFLSIFISIILFHLLRRFVFEESRRPFYYQVRECSPESRAQRRTTENLPLISFQPKSRDDIAFVEDEGCAKTDDKSKNEATPSTVKEELTKSQKIVQKSLSQKNAMPKPFQSEASSSCNQEQINCGFENDSSSDDYLNGHVDVSSDRNSDLYDQDSRMEESSTSASSTISSLSFASSHTRSLLRNTTTTTIIMMICLQMLLFAKVSYANPVFQRSFTLLPNHQSSFTQNNDGIETITETFHYDSRDRMRGKSGEKIFVFLENDLVSDNKLTGALVIETSVKVSCTPDEDKNYATAFGSFEAQLQKTCAPDCPEELRCIVSDEPSFNSTPTVYISNEIQCSRAVYKSDQKKSDACTNEMETLKTCETFRYHAFLNPGSSTWLLTCQEWKPKLMIRISQFTHAGFAEKGEPDIFTAVMDDVEDKVSPMPHLTITLKELEITAKQFDVPIPNNFLQTAYRTAWISDSALPETNLINCSIQAERCKIHERACGCKETCECNSSQRHLKKEWLENALPTRLEKLILLSDFENDYPESYLPAEYLIILELDGFETKKVSVKAAENPISQSPTVIHEKQEEDEGKAKGNLIETVPYQRCKAFNVTLNGRMGDESAVLKLTCLGSSAKSNFLLAQIICSKQKFFTLCSNTGEEEIHRWYTDNRFVDEVCTLECGGSATKFHVSAILAVLNLDDFDDSDTWIPFSIDARKTGYLSTFQLTSQLYHFVAYQKPFYGILILFTIFLFCLALQISITAYTVTELTNATDL